MKRRVVQRDGVGPAAPPWFIPTFFCSFPLKVYTQRLDLRAAFCSTVDRKHPQELLKPSLSGTKMWYLVITLPDLNTSVVGINKVAEQHFQ